MTTELAGIIVAAIGAAGACAAAYLGGRNSAKLDTIHMLVNSNLRRVEKALADALKQLEQHRAQLKTKPKRR